VSTIQPVVLVMAIASLLVGIAIFMWFSITGRDQHLQTANLIAWLLIALFPVLLIFSFFPNSSFSGGIAKGVSASGAIAAFVFLWWRGTQAGIKAAETDDHKAKIQAQNAVIAGLERDLKVQKTQGGPRVIDETVQHLYNIRQLKNKSIGIVTGNLINVKFVDIWVNSENTNMQMASFFDRSISGAIRYLGARKDPVSGLPTEDLIGDALAEQMHGNLFVIPGTVRLTTPGDLAGTHGVRGILHVAAVQGQPGVGYRQIEGIGSCVTNALTVLDERNKTENQPFRSVLFPLMGAGQGRGDEERTARALLSAATDYLTAHPGSALNRVYFLAYTDAQLATWQKLLGASKQLAGPN
jgi:O-acetyl-ADP-ribose deacetylase (regulator of RNase III)